MTNALSVEKCHHISYKALLSHLATEALVNSEDDVKFTKEIKERIRVDMECRYASLDAMWTTSYNFLIQGSS